MGALVDVVVVYLLAGRAGWQLTLALPVAIELALLNNFLWNDKLTFGNRRSGERNAPGVWSRLLHYEKVCAPAALLNAVVTLIFARRVMPLALAAAAGVVSGGAWNFLNNIPAIWRVWDLRASPEVPQRG
jgi:dolichol-phosphate mannosyltransferase